MGSGGAPGSAWHRRGLLRLRRAADIHIHPGLAHTNLDAHTDGDPNANTYPNPDPGHTDFDVHPDDDSNANTYPNPDPAHAEPYPFTDARAYPYPVSHPNGCAHAKPNPLADAVSSAYKSSPSMAGSWQVGARREGGTASSNGREGSQSAQTGMSILWTS